MLQKAFWEPVSGDCKFKDIILSKLQELFCYVLLNNCRYGDAVIELDSGVGMILQKLTSLGIDKDTLVIFSSDNGGATYAKEQGMYKATYHV